MSSLYSSTIKWQQKQIHINHWLFYNIRQIARHAGNNREWEKCHMFRNAIFCIQRKMKKFEAKWFAALVCAATYHFARWLFADRLYTARCCRVCVRRRIWWCDWRRPTRSRSPSTTSSFLSINFFHISKPSSSCYCKFLRFVVQRCFRIVIVLCDKVTELLFFIRVNQR